jgi:hypothetical protein
MRYNKLKQLSEYQHFSVDRIKLDEGRAHLAIFYGLCNKNIEAIDLF